MVVNIRVVSGGERKVRLWVPMFLLWPLVLVLILPALVLTILADVVLLLSRGPFHHSTKVLLAGLATAAETRGLRISIDGPDTNVHVSVS
jgi:hypothetical protein